MTSIFKQLSTPLIGSMNRPQWKYGFLAFVLFLLAFQIWLFASFPPSHQGNRYSGIVTCSALALNHVAFWFWFGPKAALVLRLFALIFAFAGLGFVIYSIA